MQFEITGRIMDIQLTSVTPDSPGFAELRSQSMAEGFNMLRRLEDNWLSGHNRFDRPGEKLIRCTWQVSDQPSSYGQRPKTYQWAERTQS